MNEHKNRLKAGVFAALTLLLLLVMMFYFGMSQVFIRKAGAVSCFAESVQGLSNGSDVKYQGVKVGSVKSIRILPKEKLIKVNMDIELDKFEYGGNSASSSDSERKFYDFLRREMAQGLRCRLEFVGITGMKYVSLDYYEKPESLLPAAPAVIRSEGMIYIPAVSSSFKDIMVAMTRALDRISKIKFETIYTQVEDVLKELNSTLSSPEIRTTLQHVSVMTSNLARTTGALTKVMSEERMDELIGNVNSSAAAINVLVKQLTVISEKMKLPETTSNIRDVSEAALNTRQELTVTILKLNEALDALRRVCDLISNDPGFIFGADKKAE